jgi:prepilin-type N-terminal cleavage/methylation domain-containing protein
MRLGQRGDTLVEVLISIAIISLVLGGAYVTTNRSLVASRDAQERGIALKLTEAHLERTKALASAVATPVFTTSTTSDFCIVGTAVLADSDASCSVDPSGNTTSAQPKFKLSALRTTNTFVFTTSWTKVGGTGISSVKLTYRIYPQ